jgi:hypothetical protein
MTQAHRIRSLALIIALALMPAGCTRSAKPSVEPPAIREPRAASPSAATSPVSPIATQELIKTLAALPPAAIPPGKPRFTELGCQAGDQLPAIQLAHLP